jgi:hypothetical protein
MQVPTLCERERLAGPVAERLEDPQCAIEGLGRVAEPSACAGGERHGAHDVRLGLRGTDATPDQHGLLKNRQVDLFVPPN